MFSCYFMAVHSACLMAFLNAIMLRSCTGADLEIKTQKGGRGTRGIASFLKSCRTSQLLFKGLDGGSTAYEILSPSDFLMILCVF